jgi:hypothetical protein
VIISGTDEYAVSSGFRGPRSFTAEATAREMEPDADYEDATSGLGARIEPAGEPRSGSRFTTRLLLKDLGRTSRWIAAAVSVGDLIMARRQPLNLRKLSERRR